MKSVVAASLIVGAFTSNSSSQCSGGSCLEGDGVPGCFEPPPPGPGCYEGDEVLLNSLKDSITYDWVKTVVVLEEVNGDAGVLTLRGIGLDITFSLPPLFECASIPYVRKGSKFIFELGTCSVFERKGCCSGSVPDKILDSKYEIEYCPDQDTFRLTALNILHFKKAEFLQKAEHCHGGGPSVAV